MRFNTLILLPEEMKKITAGCKQAVDKVLKLFATNEKVKKTLRRPKKEESFTPKELESHNVFVIVEDSKLKLYSPLLRIITSQCMEFSQIVKTIKSLPFYFP